MIEELNKYATSLATYVAKCYRGHPAEIDFTVESPRERVSRATPLGRHYSIYHRGRSSRRGRYTGLPKGVELFRLQG